MYQIRVFPKICTTSSETIDGLQQGFFDFAFKPLQS